MVKKKIMNKKEIIIFIISIVLISLDLYLYLADPLEKELIVPKFLFLILVTLAVFYKKFWTKVLFTLSLLFMGISYFAGITLF